MKQLIKRIIEKFFKFDGLRMEYVELDELQRLQALSKMRDKQIVNFLRERYTNNVIMLLNMKEKDADMMRGRIKELYDILTRVEKVDDDLVNINKRIQQDKYITKTSILQTFKNKLINKKHE